MEENAILNVVWKMASICLGLNVLYSYIAYNRGARKRRSRCWHFEERHAISWWAWAIYVVFFIGVFAKMAVLYHIYIMFGSSNGLCISDQTIDSKAID